MITKKLNNHGQVLILFIVFIPIFIALLTIAVDLGLITYNKKNLNGINIAALNYVKQNIEDYDEEEIKNIVLMNDKSIKIIKLEDKNNNINLVLNKKIDSIFGSIIGLREYNISSSYMINKETKKITNIKE